MPQLPLCSQPAKLLPSNRLTNPGSILCQLTDGRGVDDNVVELGGAEVLPKSFPGPAPRISFTIACAIPSPIKKCVSALLFQWYACPEGDACLGRKNALVPTNAT